MSLLQYVVPEELMEHHSTHRAKGVPATHRAKGRKGKCLRWKNTKKVPPPPKPRCLRWSMPTPPSVVRKTRRVKFYSNNRSVLRHQIGSMHLRIWMNKKELAKLKHRRQRTRRQKAIDRAPLGTTARKRRCVRTGWIQNPCRSQRVPRHKAILNNIYNLKAYALATHATLKYFTKSLSSSSASVITEFLLAFGRKKSAHAAAEYSRLMCKFKLRQENRSGIQKYLLTHLTAAVGRKHGWQALVTYADVTGKPGGNAVLSHTALGLRHRPSLFTKMAKAVPYQKFSLAAIAVKNL